MKLFSNCILLQVDSNRHLEWLKTIQKAHGSVEVSSLAQAEAINSGGVFSCGYVWKVQDDLVLVRVQHFFENEHSINRMFQELQIFKYLDRTVYSMHQLLKSVVISWNEMRIWIHFSSSTKQQGKKNHGITAILIIRKQVSMFKLTWKIKDTCFRNSILYFRNQPKFWSFMFVVRTLLKRETTPTINYKTYRVDWC